MNPVINILTRVSRPERYLSACLPSIVGQNYPFINPVAVDCPVVPDYSYNEFLNKMIRDVKSGYILILDDDDTLIPGALSAVAPSLEEDRPVVCQMLRNGNPKPADMYMDKRVVSRGRIGMPCLIIHSKHKDLFTFPATEDADYLWIKKITETLNCKFLKIPVVDAGRRSHGI